MMHRPAGRRRPPPPPQRAKAPDTGSALDHGGRAGFKGWRRCRRCRQPRQAGKPALQKSGGMRKRTSRASTLVLDVALSCTVAACRDKSATTGWRALRLPDLASPETWDRTGKRALKAVRGWSGGGGGCLATLLNESKRKAAGMLGGTATRPRFDGQPTVRAGVQGNTRSWDPC